MAPPHSVRLAAIASHVHPHPAPASGEEPKVYRVAMLGCRARATLAARAYASHPRCEVVGLCDLVPEVLNELGDELGVEPSARFEDLDAMMEAVKPDIVAIPVATELHHSLCLRVLEYPGVHLEVEKPICATLDQADEVLAKARQNGVLTAVHHQNRTGPAMRACGAALEEGRVGRLRHIIASDKGYCASAPYPS